MMMASKKSSSSTNKTKDSPGKRLGVKLSNGQRAKLGMIIIRQRGFKYRAGNNILVGKDYTLHAQKDGIVKYSKKRIKSKIKTIVSVC